jgi:hypothetical protein
MKKYILAAIISAIGCLAANANETYIVTLHKCNSLVDDPLYTEDPDSGHKARRKNYVCVIDSSGVSISGISKDQVLLYSVYENNVCVASFSDESLFVKYIYSLQGSCDIVINATTIMFSGAINLAN